MNKITAYNVKKPVLQLLVQLNPRYVVPPNVLTQIPCNCRIAMVYICSNLFQPCITMWLEEKIWFRLN